MITLIVEAVARSFALGLLVWLALAIVRPRNPHLHKTVWITVVLASFAMPFLVGLSMAPAIPAPTYVLTLQAGTGSIAPPPAHWAQSATVLYALCALVLVIRFSTGLARMWRVRQRATVLHEPWTQGDDVRASLKLSSPATFGSTILLPAGFCEWSERKLAAVMAHERSHVHRKDCYVLWLARLHTCLFWINPLAWWIQGRLAMLAEATSDDAAVSELGDRPAYAEVLLEIAASSPGPRVAFSAAQMAASEPHIAARIERIISETAPAAAPKRRHQLIAVAILLPAVAASAASLRVPPMRLAQANEPPQGAPALSTRSASVNDMAPKLIDAGGLTEMEKYYPKKAKRAGAEGMVKIAISLDADGKPTDTLILDEYPQGYGFGAAASAVVHTLGFSNPAHKPTQLSINVKFELKGGQSQSPQELPPPQSPAGG